MYLYVLYWKNVKNLQSCDFKHGKLLTTSMCWPKNSWCKQQPSVEPLITLSWKGWVISAKEEMFPLISSKGVHFIHLGGGDSSANFYTYSTSWEGFVLGKYFCIFLVRWAIGLTWNQRVQALQAFKAQAKYFQLIPPSTGEWGDISNLL